MSLSEIQNSLITARFTVKFKYHLFAVLTLGSSSVEVRQGGLATSEPVDSRLAALSAADDADDYEGEDENSTLSLSVNRFVTFVVFVVTARRSDGSKSKVRLYYSAL